MRMVDLIAKKRDGGELSREELRWIIDGYTNGTIPDYQISAWAMAVLFRGLNPRETADLTMAMVDSGETVDLTAIPGVKVDKHSTGGVGDKTTLVVGPLVAAAGIPVAKMSGRGLGHTGGTLDKLESIAGFQVELSREQFLAQVRDIGIAVIGQTGNLTPADKKLYALRDVTATVESMQLIASSIMSKKIAAGADAILLDVKAGNGAFMKTVEEAEVLARTMVEIGQQVGRKTVAVISDMNQPLGFAVGNALEVREAIDTLAGRGPADLTELALTIGAHMLMLGERVQSFAEGYDLLQEVIASGRALNKLAEMVAAQGGDKQAVFEPDRLPQAKYQAAVHAREDGYVTRIHAGQIGHASVLLGAGRLTKEMPIDLSVGIILNKKMGDRVEAGDTVAMVHANDEEKLKEALREVDDAFGYAASAETAPSLIYKVL